MADAIGSVTTALDMAAEELEQLVAGLRKQGAAAYEQRNSKEFERLNGLCELVDEFAESFAAVHQQWQALQKTASGPRRKAGKQRSSRAARGELLHEREYVFPILRFLAKNGGSAPKDEVLAAVEKSIGRRLTPMDREPLSNGQLRWRNRAAWVRNYLASGGFISRQSPRGLWQITDSGLAELAARDLDATWAKATAAKTDRETPEESVQRLISQFGADD